MSVIFLGFQHFTILYGTMITIDDTLTTTGLLQVTDAIVSPYDYHVNPDINVVSLLFHVYKDAAAKAQKAELDIQNFNLGTQNEQKFNLAQYNFTDPAIQAILTNPDTQVNHVLDILKKWLDDHGVNWTES